MAKCANCGTGILFGGAELESLRFCSNRCKIQYQYVTGLRAAEAGYQSLLARLRQNPSDPDLRLQTLQAGRQYAELARAGEGSGVTVFDELALSNDIQAACAAASTTAPPPPFSAPTVEERLQRLDGLRKKGIITEQEFQEKRSQLIAEL